MEKKTITNFDKTAIYKDEIEELVSQLKILCNKHRIPMFVTCCVKNSKKESQYISDMVGTVSNEIILKDDQIIKHVNVLNGFDTVPTNDIIEIEV